LEAQLHELAEEVNVRGREIDELQAIDKHRPWYRQVSTIVAIGALVVSLLSAAAGIQLQTAAETRAQLRDSAEDRSGLRSILQRLIVLPLETQELYTAYPEAAVELSRNVTSQYAMLTGQAVEIINQIRLRQAGDDGLSASDYNALATAMTILPGGNQEARIYFDRAADRARNLTDALTAIRSMAALDFASGSYEAGRAQYERALEMTQEYPSTPFLIASTDMETYLQWGAYELSIRGCVEAERVLDAASDIATEEDVFAWDANMKTRHEELLKSLAANCR
jgi:tetratricopeptide (TPR) repeat protein